MSPQFEAPVRKIAKPPQSARMDGTQKVRSKQHDQWAKLNFFVKVSKYDLDRANIDMQKAMQEKKHRRVVNARAKREAQTYY